MARIGRLLAAVVAGAVPPPAPAAAGEGPWRALAEERARRNPVPRSEGARDGWRLFDLNCRFCHGPAGKGDGPGAAALNPKPRDLTDPAVQGQTDGELFWKISEGWGAMPPWQQLPPNMRWNPAHYIHSLGAPR